MLTLHRTKLKDLNMFGVQTRLNDDWIIKNPEPLKYYVSPIIHKDDVVFQNNTLPRSVGTIESSADTESILRESKLTTIKGRQDLDTDRLGMTTPHIRYGQISDIDKLIPQESTGFRNQSHCEPLNDPFVECNRGRGSMDLQRILNNASYDNSNHVQNGFGINLGILPEAIDTRLVDQQYDDINHVQ